MLDVAVVGGGFAGLAVSAFLRSTGRACVTLYDGCGVAPALGFSRTASAVAGGLLHPLTPRLKPAWEAAEALREAEALIAAAEAAAGGKCVTSARAVLRPARDGADAAALERAAETAGPDWLEWLPPRPFKPQCH